LGSSTVGNGARVPEVEEPLLGLENGLFRSQAIIQFEFEEIAEPKGLSPAELQSIRKKYGSYLKAAEAIGVSEAFVRQNVPQKHTRRRTHGKTR